MVNRKKSPITEKDKKSAVNPSDDGNTDDPNTKKSRRENAVANRQKAALDGCSNPGPAPDNTQAAQNNSCVSDLPQPQIKEEENVLAAPEENKEPVPVPVQNVGAGPYQMATRSVTGRLTKRLRSFSPPRSPPPSKKQAKELPKAAALPNNTSNTPETKTRKQWEQWSIHDKNFFFEALYEHGKDFESIQSTLAQKLRKKDPNCAVRTKDHVRHFYYRNWHKIMKHIDVEGIDDLNKQALELYGLVNYGVLRKKIGKLEASTGQKLNELVHNGVTVLKFKRKLHRIKTPICRALKKLHHIEEHKEEEKSKMPDRVTIELFPRTNNAWTQVQTLAQNPRLRVSLKVNKRVSSLIEFINKKWIPDRIKMKEKLNESETLATEIKVHVSDVSKLTPLLVKQAHTVPKLEFSFKSYLKSKKEGELMSPSTKKPHKGLLSKLEEFTIQQPSASSSSSAPPSSAPRNNLQDSQVSSSADLRSKHDSPEKSSFTDSSSSKNLLSISTNLPLMLLEGDNAATDVKCIPDDSATPFRNFNEQDRLSANKCDKENISDADIKPSVGEMEASDKLNRLKQGLLIRDCGTMTIAEVYMMMGCPGKLFLEYEWVEKKIHEDIWELNKKLTNMLRRLVHLATTEFIDFKKVKPTIPQLNRSPTSKCCCGASRKDGTPPGNKLTGRSRNSPSVRVTAKNSPSTSKRPPSPATPKQDRVKLLLNVNTTPTSSKTDGVFQSLEVARLSEGPTSSSVPAAAAAASASGDGVFKLPQALPPRAPQPIRPALPGHNLADKTQLLQQMNMVNMVARHKDLFVPRRGGHRRMQRNVRRPLVVQRTLLPKNQTPARQIMTYAMVPAASATGQTASFLPVHPPQTLTSLVSNTHLPPTIVTATAQTADGTQVVNTSKGKVTTMSVQSLNKGGVRRRIVPMPVTSISGESSMFSKITQFGKTDLLKQAALEACIVGISDAASNTGAGFSVSMGPTATVTSQSGAMPLSQVDSVTEGDPILSANTLSTMSDQPGKPVVEGLTSDLSNISTLLDISVPCISDMGESTDKLLDLALLNSSSGFGVGLCDKEASLSSLLNSCDDRQAHSPMKGFRGITSLGSSDEQWLTDDFSIGSLLDTPVRKASEGTTQTTKPTPALSRMVTSAHEMLTMMSQSQSLCSLNESSRDSMILGKLDVDTALQCMMNENSIDYMAKFADLAATIAASANTDTASTSRKPSELLEDKAA